MATKLEVLDQNGTVLSDLKADATGLRCRLTVEIEKNINSSDIPLPKSITVTYQNKWHKTIESETKSFVGKKMIYLLKGKDFAPVDHFQFVESVENADKIRELIEAQKKDK